MCSVKTPFCSCAGSKDWGDKIRLQSVAIISKENPINLVSLEAVTDPTFVENSRIVGAAGPACHNATDVEICIPDYLDVDGKISFPVAKSFPIPEAWANDGHMSAINCTDDVCRINRNVVQNDDSYMINYSTCTRMTFYSNSIKNAACTWYASYTMKILLDADELLSSWKTNILSA